MINSSGEKIKKTNQSGINSSIKKVLTNYAIKNTPLFSVLAI